MSASESSGPLVYFYLVAELALIPNVSPTFSSHFPSSTYYLRPEFFLFVDLQILLL